MSATLAGRRRWPGLARSLPMAVYLLFLALAPDAAGALAGAAAAGAPAFDPRWLYAWRIVLVAGVLVALARDYGELALPPAVRRADWGWAVLLGAGVFALWIGLDGGWAVIGASPPAFVPLNEDGALLWPLIAVRLFGAAVVVPVMEELFWRSFVQRWLDAGDFLALAPAVVSWRSVLLTSLAFGFEHRQWLAGIVAGLAYGYLYRRSGSLWPPVVAHALTNLLLGVWVVGSGQWQFW